MDEQQQHEPQWYTNPVPPGPEKPMPTKTDLFLDQQIESLKAFRARESSPHPDPDSEMQTLDLGRLRVDQDKLKEKEIDAYSVNLVSKELLLGLMDIAAGALQMLKNGMGASTESGDKILLTPNGPYDISSIKGIIEMGKRPLMYLSAAADMIIK